jgi:hypothetical protein
VKRLLAFIALSGSLVLACAGSDGHTTDSAPTDPAATGDEQDVNSGKKCGTFLNGECAKGYWCDMSSVPPGNVGGAGVCRKEHPCILNGLFRCPAGQSFDASVCHCR